jgi:hypothetical protein
MQVTVFTFSFYYTLGIQVSVPALANARPDCDPLGGPLKFIVQSKKKD